MEQVVAIDQPIKQLALTIRYNDTLNTSLDHWMSVTH